jgi:hypothetical protein
MNRGIHARDQRAETLHVHRVPNCGYPGTHAVLRPAAARGLGELLVSLANAADLAWARDRVAGQEPQRFAVRDDRGRARHERELRAQLPTEAAGGLEVPARVSARSSARTRTPRTLRACARWKSIVLCLALVPPLPRSQGAASLNRVAPLHMFVCAGHRNRRLIDRGTAYLSVAGRSS